LTPSFFAMQCCNTPVAGAAYYDAQTGLPRISAEEKAAGFRSGVRINIMAQTILPAIGFGLAYLLWYISEHLLNMESYDLKMKTVAESDTWYVYLSAFFLCRMMYFLNFYPLIFKGSVFGISDDKSKAEKAMSANMYVYKVQSVVASGFTGTRAVLMADDGYVGRYNRANRGLHHSVEWLGIVLLEILLCGYIFPKQTLALVTLYAVGRVVHQVAHAIYGYGAQNVGFVLCLIAALTLEGLLMLTVIKGSHVGLHT